MVIQRHDVFTNEIPNDQASIQSFLMCWKQKSQKVGSIQHLKESKRKKRFNVLAIQILERWESLPSTTKN